MACSRWRATAVRRCSRASASTYSPRTVTMHGRFFYNADAEMLIVPQLGRLRIGTEMGVLEVAAAGSRGDSARRAFSRRTAGWPGARLCRREFRRASAPARTGADRLEWSGECARFPDAGRGVRRSGRRIRTGREIPGPAVVGAHRSFAARRRRAGTATTRRTNTICACSTRSARSATIIPIRRSSPCSPRRAIRRAWRTWIS